MSPQRACNVCGRPNCARHRRRRAPTRSYSNTAAYRAMVAAVLDTYGDACVYCRESTEGDLVLAHIVAHADGGEFVLENLRPAHARCNKSAGR